MHLRNAILFGLLCLPSLVHASAASQSLKPIPEPKTLGFPYYGSLHGQFFKYNSQQPVSELSLQNKANNEKENYTVEVMVFMRNASQKKVIKCLHVPNKMTIPQLKTKVGAKNLYAPVIGTSKDEDDRFQSFRSNMQHAATEYEQLNDIIMQQINVARPLNDWMTVENVANTFAVGKTYATGLSKDEDPIFIMLDGIVETAPSAASAATAASSVATAKK